MDILQDVTLIHGDCMDYMRTIPDKAFDLAIVDPPYGLDRYKNGIGKNDRQKTKSSSIFNNNPPTESYFKELFRVSKNQIVFGANNFVLPPTEYFLIWNKQQTVENFASAEYAWVSMGLKMPAKVFDYSIHKHNHTDKIHPTQKPVALYKWILKNYAKQNDTILDTHLGSGSSAIAAHDGHFKFTGIELDDDYYEAAKKRIEYHQRQQNLF
jgi:site-specific DNA-methyltransferase (adenine-specific)